MSSEAVDAEDVDAEDVDSDEASMGAITLVHWRWTRTLKMKS